MLSSSALVKELRKALYMQLIILKDQYMLSGYGKYPSLKAQLELM